MTDRAALLLEDSLAEPAMLEALLSAYAAPGGPLAELPTTRLAGARIVFTGLGSSRYGALDAAPGLRIGGRSVSVELASTDPARATPPAPDVVLVAVSASGRTSEVLETVRRHRRTSLVVAVTNHPDAPIATEADVVLPLLAGEERSGVASLTFTATVAVLALLAGRLGHGPAAADLRPAVGGLRAVGDGRDRWLGPAADTLDGAGAIGVVGDGGTIGTLEQAALMLREGPRLAAHAHDAGDWLHTAIYTALPGYAALLVTGTRYDRELLRTIGRRAGRIVTAGEDRTDGAAAWVPLPTMAGAHPIVRSLTVSAVAGILAAELWSRTRASDGPGRPAPPVSGEEATQGSLSCNTKGG
jgi:glucosamine--fructose-6-phosphate aminotransferase (isomerizing)